MASYRRYAVYYTPPPGEFADFGASWLGWDAATGREVAQPDLDGLDLAALTAGARRYGFHATLKAPFRLADGCDEGALLSMAESVALALRPVTLPGLQLTPIGGFLALTPAGEGQALSALADTVVQALEPFRAPLTEAEIARRHPERLSERQRALLHRFGYPYGLEEFRFHMTLSDALEPETQARLTTQLVPHLAVLPVPFVLDSISVMGEGADGRMRLIRRIALSGE